MKLFFIPFFTKNAIADEILGLDWPNLVTPNMDIDQTCMPNLVKIHAKILEPVIAKIDTFLPKLVI